MSVKLDQLPDPAPRPKPPRPLPWLGLLVSSLLLGVATTALFGDAKITHEPWRFWSWGLGAPLAGWLLVAGIRWLVYIGRHLWADGWDERREQVILQETRRGRRALHILDSKFYTAFYDVDVADSQLQALIHNQQALKTQASWNEEEGVRHSRLPCMEDEPPEALLARLFTDAFDSISETLAAFPADYPLSVLLEVNSVLPQNQIQEIWHTVWAEAEIHQSVQFIPGRGLSVVDDWLDTRSRETGLLLVVAVQIHPPTVALSAESVVVLLLGNRLTQKILPPLACLHRPEFTPIADLSTGVEHALDWVPAPAQAVQHAWLCSLPSAGHEAFTALLTTLPLSLSLDDGVYDLDTMLGQAGCVAPWLAIAAAAEEAVAANQLIISSTPDEAGGIWSTIISSYPTLQETVS